MRTWPQPPSRLRLARQEIHVWSYTLDRPADDYTRLAAVLSNEETERVNRYQEAEGRHRFVAARGMLRFLLGRYLGCDPAAVPFRYGLHGKPYLAIPGGPQFNLAYRGNLAVVGLTSGRAIGIDLEQIRPQPDLLMLARHLFSQREQEELCALPEEQRADAFFTTWTRKEAVIKARGEGQTLQPQAFDVTIQPGELPRILRTRPDRQEAARWTLLPLNPPAGYRATVAVEGPGGRLLCWRFDH